MFEQSLGFVDLSLNMGRKGRKAGPLQASAPWMKASAGRIGKHQAVRGDATCGVSETTFVELGTRPRRAIAAGEPVAPGANEETEFRTSEEVMAMVHRGGEEGLLASGFSPDRHIVYICGRPVQVFVKSHGSFTMTSQHILIPPVCPCFPDVLSDSKHESKTDFVDEDGHREIEFVAISGG